MPVIGDQVGLRLDRIVFATHLQPDMEKATEYVKRLARRYSSSVIIVYVAETSTGNVDVENNLELLLRDLTAEGIRATAHTMEARNAAIAIVGLAKQMDASLIVTGTAGRRGVRKMIEGSCSEAIIRHAPCPVLTIGPKAKLPAERNLCFERIVFATDLDVTAVKKSLVAVSFAQDCEARIYLCHVLEKPDPDFSKTIAMRLRFEAALRRLIPASRLEGCSPECFVAQGETGPQILGLARKVDADLMIVGAKRVSSWLVPIGDGIVGQILANAGCPVLTICAV